MRAGISFCVVKYTGSLSGFFRGQCVQSFLHIFLQDRKLDRADLEKILMKNFWIKIITKSSLPFVF